MVGKNLPPALGGDLIFFGKNELSEIARTLMKKIEFFSADNNVDDIDDYANDADDADEKQKIGKKHKKCSKLCEMARNVIKKFQFFWAVGGGI